MLDITGLGGTLHPLQDKQKKKTDSSKSKGVKKQSFGSVLQSESREIETDGLQGIPEGSEAQEELLDQVWIVGEKLREKRTIEVIKEYKETVRKFLNYIVKNSLRIEEKEGRLRPATMERPRYSVITVVNQKLEQLAAYVLQNQKEQIEILRKVEEIYGLLVDLKS